MKRVFVIFSVFISLLLTMNVIHLSADAATGTQIPNTGIFWRIENDELIIEYSGSGSSEIPNFTGYGQPWRGESFSIITIGDGITKIGDNSFHEFYLIEKINWPSTIQIIGNEVFSSSSFTFDSISIPEGVEEIGSTLFGRLSEDVFSSITFPSTLKKINAYTLLGTMKDGGTVTFLGDSLEDGVIVDHWRDSKKIHLVVPYGTSEAYRSKCDENWIIDITELPPVPKDDNRKTVNAHVHKFIWKEITAPTTISDGIEGEICSCGAIGRKQPLSAYVYALNEYATPMINVSKSGQTIKFQFGEWNSFPKSFMEKIAAKVEEGVSFEFNYKWNHVKQQILIPAGSVVDTELDWYGPAKMEELYGAN